MKVMRMSGRPVSLEQFAAYDAEFKARFDAIYAEVGTNMLEFQAKLVALDEELKPKYSLVEEWPMPTTPEEVNAIMTAYETPIMFAKSAEAGNEVLLLLMDEQL